MPGVPYTKPALTFAAQLQQLKDRGLNVENDSKAIHLLENISYYRLSGYWYPLLQIPKEAHLFKSNASFDTSFKLYCLSQSSKLYKIHSIKKK